MAVLPQRLEEPWRSSLGVVWDRRLGFYPGPPSLTFITSVRLCAIIMVNFIDGAWLTVWAVTANIGKGFVGGHVHPYTTLDFHWALAQPTQRRPSPTSSCVFHVTTCESSSPQNYSYNPCWKASLNTPLRPFFFNLFFHCCCIIYFFIIGYTVTFIKDLSI